jgi:hypothetical protein
MADQHLTPQERAEVAKALGKVLSSSGSLSDAGVTALKKYSGAEVDAMVKSIAAITGTAVPMTPDTSPLMAWVAGKLGDADMGALLYEFRSKLGDIQSLLYTTKGDQNVKDAIDQILVDVDNDVTGPMAFWLKPKSNTMLYVAIGIAAIGAFVWLKK